MYYVLLLRSCLWFKKYFINRVGTRKNCRNLSVQTRVLQPTPEKILYLLQTYSSRTLTLQVHSHLITNGSFCSDVNKIKIKLWIWNTLLRKYAQGNFPEEALQLYPQMQKFCTDGFTFSFLLKACANMMHDRRGIQIHTHSIKVGFQFHVYPQTALINMYAVCGLLEDAKKVFDEVHERNSVTWNVLITGFAKWGKVHLAQMLLEQMDNKTVISWTGVIDGYVLINRPLEAFALFRRMMVEGFKPNASSILTILTAISNLSALSLGESIHVYGEKSGFKSSDICINNSLMHMYAKCGCIKHACRIFQEISERRTLVSWTTMITGLAMHGMVEEASTQMKEMKNLNIVPNDVTLLSVLNACSHRGLVADGLNFFSEMVNGHGIKPTVKHYGCLVDLLGRAGRLEEAEKIILEMPIKGNVVIWRTLLGACSFHGNVEIGKRIMKKILEMEKDYGGDYVLLSNIFSGVGKFADAEKVRRLMDERNVGKVPGLSLFDGKKTIYSLPLSDLTNVIQAD